MPHTNKMIRKKIIFEMSIILLIVILSLCSVSAKALDVMIEKNQFTKVQRFEQKHFNEELNTSFSTYSFDKACLGLPYRDPFIIGQEDSRKYCAVWLTFQNPTVYLMDLNQKLTTGFGFGLGLYKQPKNYQYLVETNESYEVQVPTIDYIEEKCGIDELTEEEYCYTKTHYKYNEYETIMERCGKESLTLWEKILGVWPWYQPEPEIICWNETIEHKELIYHPETRYRMVWKPLKNFKTLSTNEDQEVLLFVTKDKSTDNVEWHTEINYADKVYGVYPFFNGTDGALSYAAVTPFENYTVDDFETYGYWNYDHYYSGDKSDNKTDMMGDSDLIGESYIHAKDGLFDYAFNFSGLAGSHLTLPNATKPTDAFTISMWFKFAGSLDIGPANPGLIGGKSIEGKSVGNGGVGLEFLNVTGQLFLNIANSTNTSECVSTTTSWGSGWHQVVAVYKGNNSGTSGQELWIDGVEEDAAGNMNIVGDIAFADNVNWRIGSVESNSFNGSIDDIKIFKRSLNASEILNLYNNKSAIYQHSDWNELDGKIEIVNVTDEFGNPTLVYAPQARGVYNWSIISNSDYSNFTYIGKFYSVGTDGQPIFAFRMTDGTGYGVVVQPWANRIGFYKFVSYAYDSSYNSTTDYTINGDTWYYIKIVADGTNIKVYYSSDGHTYTLALDNDETTDNYKDGNIGTGYHMGVDDFLYFDNILIQEHLTNATSTEDYYGYIAANQNISVSYMYNDPDGDALGRNTYSWYKDGVLSFTGGNYYNSSDNSIVGEWFFEETAQDTSGNDNDGVVSGAVHSNFGNHTCQVGGCYYFDGNDYIYDTTLSGDMNMSVFTLSHWINADVLTGDNRVIISKSNSESYLYKNFRSYILSNGNPYLEIKNGTDTASFQNTKAVISLGTWYNLVWAYNGTDFFSYVNGALNNSATGKNLTGLIYNRTQVLEIGSAEGNTKDWFNGSIDEVIIWNRSLSSSEILAIYNAGKYNNHLDSSYTSLFEEWEVGILVCDVTNNCSQVGSADAVERDIAGQSGQSFSADSGTAASGLKIAVPSKMTIKNITLHSATPPPTKAYISTTNNTDDAIATADIYGLKANFSYEVEPGNYYILIDKEGASYDSPFVRETLPLHNNNFDVLEGVNTSGLISLNSWWGIDKIGVNPGNISFSIWESVPLVTYFHPTADQTLNSSTFALNITSVSPGESADTCYYSINSTANVTMTQDGTSNYFNSTLTASLGKNNLSVWCNNSFGNSNYTDIAFALDAVKTHYANKDNVVESENVTFTLQLNFTTITDINATFIFNNTEYAPDTISNSSLQANFTKTLDIAVGTQAGSYDYNWTYTLNGWTNATINRQITIFDLILGLCNSTNEVTFINFTFIDEDTSLATNGSLIASSWTYWVTETQASDPSSFTFSNLTANQNYAFCVKPNWTNITASVNLQYSFIGYPQRRYGFTNLSLTNVSTNRTLYLLSSSDGLYSRYAAIDSVSGIAIEGVLVRVQREIGGVDTTIERDTTDASGLVTFWLDPDADHDFMATKDLYAPNLFTVRPAFTDPYYIIMSRIEAVNIKTNVTQGLSYTIYPTAVLLINDTEYTFEFNASSPYTSIDSIGMNLTNGSSQIVYITRSGEGNITFTLDTDSFTKIRGIFSVVQGTEIFEIVKIWSIADYFTDDYSLFGWIKNFATYDFEELGDGIRVLIMVMIFLGVGTMLYKVDVLDSSIAAIGGLIALTGLFSYIEWLTIELTGNAIVNQWTIFIITLFLGISLILWRIE